ncbi:Ppx/GppA family phosphatase [Actinoplanes sp. NBC_00393]|uniref:Ppx/GppA phosphatase family protein n=1 Tax=Actinoplanes sp. NBC_00393 TaxID=2975953 RepID=UPI0032529E19
MTDLTFSTGMSSEDRGTRRSVRMGVLDIGSNAAQLLVIDSCAGSPPLPVYREKRLTRVAPAIRADGAITAAGVRRLVAAVCATVRSAREHQVDELFAYATAAVRDATNRDQIVAALRAEAGLEIGFLTGEDEGRLSYFAAHRWYGWSAGPLLLLDIGGGSMEIVQGRDEDPAVSLCLPLGARRLTHSHLPDHPADGKDVKRLRRHVRDVLTPAVRRLDWEQRPQKVVATSKTFKQLARFAGEAGTLRRRELRSWIPRLARMTPAQRAELPGVARSRARQLLAGAIIAETTMAALGVERLEVCPWGLREGVLLRRISPPPGGHALRAVRLTAPPGVSRLHERRRAR